MDSRAGNVQVSLLTWEMLEWEVHALRAFVTVTRVDLQFAARQHPDNAVLVELDQQTRKLSQTFRDNHNRALRDQAYREIAIGSTRQLLDQIRELEDNPNVDQALVDDAIERLERALVYRTEAE